MSSKPVKKVRIPAHKHCPICGASMPIDAEFCSDECKDKYLQKAKRDRKMRLFFLLFYAVMMAVLFLFLIWRPA
jgi:predicted nucleic acid-binding Zn ribbon protein